MAMMKRTMKRTLRLFDRHALLEFDDGNYRTAVLTPSTPTTADIDASSVQVKVVPAAEAPGGSGAPFAPLDVAAGKGSNAVAIEAVIGVYELLSGPFIAVVLESEPRLHGLGLKGSVASGWDFRLVNRVGLLPLFKEGRRLSAQQQRDDDKYLALLQGAFAEHQLYFSHTHDVTHSFQRLASLDRHHKGSGGAAATVAAGASSESLPGHALWQRADPRFFWNRLVVRPFTSASGAHAWVTPMMSAFVTMRPSLTAAGLRFSLLFVSRRSCFRQGCRFTKRGADAEGRCANFVETEQALVFESGAVSSFVQVRGSIPCLWSSAVSLKYAPKVAVDGDDPRNAAVFAKHVASLHAEFESVLLVNLIDKKKDQGRLGLVFQQLFDAWVAKHANAALTGGAAAGAVASPPGLRQRGAQSTAGEWSSSSSSSSSGGGQGHLDLLWFDFHKECAKMQWHNLSKVFERRGEALDQHGWFAADGLGEVLQLQRGVTRTNCMDNLDRTNVVQSVIARRAVLAMLTGHPGATVPQTSGVPSGGGSVLQLPSPHFDGLEGALKGTWGDNADAISMLYSGTGALKTDFTRTGKRTLAGAFSDGVNSCMRFYINNFVDGDRQDGVDLLTGVYTPSPAKPTPFAPRKGQTSLASVACTALACAACLFGALAVLLKDRPLPTLAVQCLALAWVGFVGLMGHGMKSGSALGKRLVAHPRLCPEC